MAKGNVFLGLASGSVGDVTLYRRGGQQISRARVRQISNPKSNAQIYQRAILSTVAKAYAAGKAIFDHSFEGYSVPSGAARYFSARNLSGLRSRVYADVQAQVSDPQANPLVGPRSTSPVAGLYYVSEGSLTQSFITSTPADFDYGAAITFGETPVGTGTLADYADYYGLVDGDIFTLVFFAYFTVSAGLTPLTKFAWIRYKLRPRSELAAVSAAGARLSQMFTISTSDNIRSCVLSSGLAYLGVSVYLADSTNLFVEGIGLSGTQSTGCGGSFAIIRSRENSNLRSTAQMEWLVGDDHEGLSYNDVLTAWSEGLQLGDSNLILEGGGSVRAAADTPLMMTSFDNPIAFSDFLQVESPTLIFPLGVTFTELNSRLSVSLGGQALTPYVNGAVLEFRLGSTSYVGVTEFAGSANSVSLEGLSSSGDGDILFSFA